LLWYDDVNILSFVSDTETTSDKARRWGAFVCPDCRFVFRVPSDHDGIGIICPSCRRMLRIPKEGDAVSSLMAPLQKINFSDDEIDPRGEKRIRSKQKRQKKEAEVPDWDASAGKWKSNRSGIRSRKLKLLVGGSVLIAAAGLGLLYWETLSREEVDDNITGLPALGEVYDSPSSALLLPEEELDGVVELPKVMKLSENEFLEEAQLLAEKFLNATSIKEILPLVRNREGVEGAVRSFYPNGRIKAVGMNQFNSSGRPSYKDDFAAVSVLTPNFEQRQLAFFDGEEGLKIDWESWVGWSEVPWEVLIETRPTRPVLVRVMLKWVDYYNFDFKDEKAWRAYRLVSPDGEHLLFGYAPRNSLLDQQLRPNEPGATVAVTLKIRFPKGDSSEKQVIIEEQVADGWVIPRDS